MQELCKKETAGCMSGWATKHICFCLLRWCFCIYSVPMKPVSLVGGASCTMEFTNQKPAEKKKTQNLKKRGWEQKIAIETALGSEQEVSLMLNSQSRLCHKDRQSYVGVGGTGEHNWQQVRIMRTQKKTDRKQCWHRAQEKTSFKVKAENNPKRLTGMNTNTYY